MESITLQKGGTIISSGDAVGQLQFAAPSESDGGASRYVIGQIYAYAEGAFNASSNPASIVISTSAADNLPASGKLKITHEGHVLPMKDNAYDLGSPDFRFRDLYVTSEVTSPTGNFDYIFFDTTIGDEDLVQGQMNWNSEAGTVELGLTDDLKIQLGQTVLFRVKNSTGSTLSKGQAVYASGVLGGGQIIQAAKFAADQSVDEVRFIGLMTDDLANGDDGFVNHFGHIKNVDLRTSNTAVNPNGETWAVGDILYVDDGTAGGLTKSAPQDDIYVAMVLADGQNGELFVRITDPGHITDLHDVNLSGLVDNNLMVWNSGANYWEPTSSMTFDGTTLHLDTDGISAKFGRDNALTNGGKVRIYVDDGDTAGSNQAIKAFNNKSTGTNYGINATTYGSGTRNVALYGYAERATQNWGLQVAAGISYFQDNIGIKTSSPGYELTVAGSGYVSNDFYVSGNVGIGTTSPVTKLDVSGVITATGGDSDEWNEAYDWVAASGGLPYVTGVGTANQVAFFNGTDSITSESNLYWDSTNDRLGIGTNTPLQDLEIKKTDGILKLTHTSPGGRPKISFGSIGTEQQTIYKDHVSNDLIFKTSQVSESIRIDWQQGHVIINEGGEDRDFRVESDSNANMLFVDGGQNRVGIGTASPSAALDVNGSVNVANDVIVGGNVTINGTTVTANADSMQVKDPIITLGLASGNVITNDTYDRGLALVTNNGTAFMGWDNSADKFVMLSSGVATNSSGNYDAGTWGNLEINELYTNNAVNIQQATDDENAGLVIKNANGIYSNKLYANSYNSVYKSAGDFTVNLGATNRAFYISHAGSAAWEMNKDYIRPYSVAGSASIFAGDGGYFGFAQIGNTLSKSVMSLHNWTGNYDYGVALYYRASGVGVGLTKGLVLDNRGRVGINDETPSYTLDVSGSGRFTGAAVFESTIDAANLGAGEDNSVVILDSDGKLRTDEIDSRVWGSSLVGGSGNLNYVTKWTSSSGIGNSQIWDNGLYVGIGIGNPSERLVVNGNIQTVGLGSKIILNGTQGLEDPGNGSDLIIRTVNGERIRVLDSGNVGIGISTPSDKLHVYTTTSYDGILVGGSTTPSVTFDGSGSYIDWRIGNAGSNVNSFTIADGTSGSNERFLISESGYVGIGTSSPGYKLDVNGTANFSSTINAASLGAGEDNSVVILDSDGKLRTDEIDSRVWGTSLVDGAGTTNYVAKWSDADTVTNSQIFDNGSSVGIGTSSPLAKLHIQGSGYQQGLLIERTDTSSKWGLAGLSSGGFQIWDDNQGDATRFVINSSGDVGIGTDTPSQKLDVAGSGNFSGDVTITGHLSAATKSFLIKHPTREGHKLQYGSLESPYHGVRLTGRAKIENGWCVVKLPEYISELVHNNNDINIQITNIKHGKVLYVDDTNIANNEFTVKTDSWFNRSGIEFYWTFTAVRKDVQELQVEF